MNSCAVVGCFRGNGLGELNSGSSCEVTGQGDRMMYFDFERATRFASRRVNGQSAFQTDSAGRTFKFLFANADYPLAGDAYGCLLFTSRLSASSLVLHTYNEVNRSRVCLAVERQIPLSCNYLAICGYDFDKTASSRLPGAPRRLPLTVIRDL